LFLQALLEPKIKKSDKVITRHFII